MRFDHVFKKYFPKILNIQTIIASLVAAIIVAIAYWEFVYDINPKEALEYFKQIESVPDADNAVFAFAGIAAPLSVKDIHHWGKLEISNNTVQFLNGEGGINVLDDEPGVDNRLFINWNVGNVYGCWLPGASEDGYPGCIDEASMKKVIDTNRTLLERYKSVFDYNHYDSEPYYYEGFENSITLTKLLAIDFWVNRDNLTDEDVSTVFKFFRFWEKVSRFENVNAVVKAVALVNHGIAGLLLGRLSERDPTLIERYAHIYGKFFYERAGSRDIDSVNRGEFRFFNSEFCFIKRYSNRKVLCKPRTKSLSFKPGRTIQLIFENRLKEETCTTKKIKPQKNQYIDNDTSLWGWEVTYMRPGNYRGRAIANLVTEDLERVCDYFRNINKKAEENELRNLYLYFKQNHFDPDKIYLAYLNSNELFRIKDTDRYFRWDNEKKELIWELEESSLVKYAIPYF